MVNGAVRMTRVAVPLMTSGGRVIHVTSIHGERAEANASAYAMAKAAINSFCRGLALELAGDGILVNAIAPGFIDTPMSVINGVNELESEWFKKNYMEGHHLPLRRAGSPTSTIPSPRPWRCAPRCNRLPGSKTRGFASIRPKAARWPRP